MATTRNPRYVAALALVSALILSPLVTSLAVGATMVHMTDRSRPLFGALPNTDPPFYAIFS